MGYHFWVWVMGSLISVWFHSPTTEGTDGIIGICKKSYCGSMQRPTDTMKWHGAGIFTLPFLSASPRRKYLGYKIHWCTKYIKKQGWCNVIKSCSNSMIITIGVDFSFSTSLWNGYIASFRVAASHFLLFLLQFKIHKLLLCFLLQFLHKVWVVWTKHLRGQYWLKIWGDQSRQKDRQYTLVYWKVNRWPLPAGDTY